MSGLIVSSGDGLETGTAKIYVAAFQDHYTVQTVSIPQLHHIYSHMHTHTYTYRHTYARACTCTHTHTGNLGCGKE